MTIDINKNNVGRVAERIVANELETRGFRVSDLNKGGPSANADLLAAGNRRVWQIQVKGASNKSAERWWVQYGYCDQPIIDHARPMFNRHSSFYRADVVVLVAVRTPSEYRCVVLPVAAAEEAAQMNVELSYRRAKRDGDKKKPGKVWLHLDESDRERRVELRDQERDIFRKYRDVWGVLLGSPAGASTGKI